ncbi:MAG: T9SS type A sorting domain-containing protein [Balneolaceae bacterium]|nr:T9SS type A sorting domain-containing protein [Balneolaceae bacterium]
MLKFSAGGEFLYAATQGEGVFRYQLREVVTTSTEPSLDVPKQIRLNQNYPNPFNPSTVIRYSLAQAAMVQLEVFDTSGRKVATLVHRHKAAGEHTVTFDASKLSSGIYLYKLNANGHQISRKMTLVK